MQKFDKLPVFSLNYKELYFDFLANAKNGLLLLEPLLRLIELILHKNQPE